MTLLLAIIPVFGISRPSDAALKFDGLSVFRESIPVYCMSTDVKRPRLMPFRRAWKFPREYAQRVPDDLRRKTPYGPLDLFDNPGLTVDSDYARSGKPFFIYNHVGRPPFFMAGDGCPLADRSAYAAWKRSHPGLVAVNTLWELDSDSFFFDKFYDNMGDASITAELQRVYARPADHGKTNVIQWAQELFRRARDFNFGETAIWPMCSNDMGFEHIFGACGAKGLWYEATSQEIGAWNCAAAFVRGAARQRGLEFGWYAAHYYQGWTRKGDARAGDNRWCADRALKLEPTPHRGESRSLHRRQILFGWLSGAKYLQTEWWTWLYADEKDGKVVPSDYARDIEEIYRLSKTTDVGEPYTPLAVLVPLAEPSSSWYDNKRLMEPDVQRAIFDTLVPIRGDDGKSWPDRRKGEQGCLYNSEFAGFFDTLCPDAGQPSPDFARALARYRYALVAGDAFDKRKLDVAALRQFKAGGGVLLRYPSPMCDTPGKLRDLLRTVQDETMPVSVAGDVQWGVNRTKGGWLVYLINNRGVIKFVDEPEDLDATRTVHVTVTEKATGRTFVRDIAPGDFALVSIRSKK